MDTNISKSQILFKIGKHEFNVYKREILDYDSFVYDLFDRALNIDHHLHAEYLSFTEGNSDYFGSENLFDAIEMAIGGIDNHLNNSIILSKIEIIESILRTEEFINFEYDHDVSGDDIDIERYLRGEPENMIYYDYNKKHRYITIYVNTGYNRNVDMIQVVNRGAAIISLINMLEANGFSVRLYAVKEISNFRNIKYIKKTIPSIYHIRIMLKDFVSMMNYGCIIYALCETSFNRRLLLFFQELEDLKTKVEMGFYKNGGYGNASFDIYTRHLVSELKHEDELMGAEYFPGISSAGRYNFVDEKQAADFISSRIGKILKSESDRDELFKCRV